MDKGTTQGNEMTRELPTNEKTNWVEWVKEQREAGHEDAAIKDAIRARFPRLSDTHVELPFKRIDAPIEMVANSPTCKTAPSRIRRRVTEDDASMYGSQYLGREGQIAWMPR